MFKKLLVGIFGPLVIANAQTFKRHHIGETTAEFLAVEPALSERLESCVNDKPHELTIEEVKQRFGKKKAEEMQRQQAALPAGSHLAFYATDLDEYRDRCDALVSALKLGTGEIWGTGYLLFPQYARCVLRNAL